MPSTVLAQAWRGGPRRASLVRLLAGCQIEDLDAETAKAVGRLIGRSGAIDVVDVSVVEGAIRRADVVVTSDPDDLGLIAGAAGRRLVIEVV